MATSSLIDFDTFDYPIGRITCDSCDYKYQIPRDNRAGFKISDYLFEIASTDNRGYREMYAKLQSMPLNPIDRYLVQAYFRYLEPLKEAEGAKEGEDVGESTHVEFAPVSVPSDTSSKPSLLSRLLSGKSQLPKNL